MRPLRNLDAASLDSNNAMSDGFGMKIVRSPMKMPVPTDVEKNLQDRIRELEEKVQNLEREKNPPKLEEEQKMVESMEPEPEQS